MTDTSTDARQPFDYLALRAVLTPNGACFDALDQTLTFEEVHRHATQIAGVMREIGVRPGDTVALELPTGMHLLFLEAVFHEAAISCMLQSVAANEDTFVADWLFSSAADSSRLARRTVPVDREFLQRVRAQRTDIPALRYPSAQSICRVVFSSGTTGFPKPVAFTVEMIEYRARAAARFWMHTPPFMSLLDVGTVSGFQTFYSSVMRGVPYLVPGTAEHNLAQIQRHSVASIKASPAQIAALTEAVLRAQVKTESLRIVQFAGTSLPPPVARSARAAMGAQIHNLYGSTETGTISARYEDSDSPFDAGTVTPESEVQVVDDAHNPLPSGEVGIIRYRRPLQAVGYYQDPEATASSFRDGWFYPGDNGSLSSDGRLTLAGRTSEMVNAGGVKIDPARVDAFAAELTGIRDVAGFAHVNRTGMTEFILAIVCNEFFDSQRAVEELTHAFGTARPSVLFQVPSIPRNDMGKPLRQELALVYARTLQPGM